MTATKQLIGEVLHALADEIADQFGGDLDEHPQAFFEKQAIQDIEELIVNAETEAYKKGFIDGSIKTLTGDLK
jgi:hypothetical protein